MGRLVAVSHNVAGSVDAAAVSHHGVGIARRQRDLIRAAADLDAAGDGTDTLDPLSKLVAQAASLARGGGGAGMSPWELPIVVDCRQLIANTLAQLPLIAYRNRLPRCRSAAPRVATRPG